MIYTEIELEIPKKKRIQKSTGYVYEILERNNKETGKDKVILVGRLSKNGLLNPNENYFTLHPDITMAPYKLQYSSETSQTLIKELDKIQLEKISGIYISRYILTSRQRQILALFGLRYNDVVSAIKIVNQTMKIS